MCSPREDFTKIVRIGSYRPSWTKKSLSVYCRVTYRDGNLSITGVEGPLVSGSCRGSCGQIVDTLSQVRAREWRFADGWSAALLSRFLRAWASWHLNNLRAGSPRQREWLAANPIDPGDCTLTRSHYAVACERLAEAGLNPDTEFLFGGLPYRYGTAWLREEIPSDVLGFLVSLPDTDRKPAWV